MRISGERLLWDSGAFSRVLRALRGTPAMATGITGRLWELEDIARLAD